MAEIGLERVPALASSLLEVAERCGTPTYVYDLEDGARSAE